MYLCQIFILIYDLFNNIIIDIICYSMDNSFNKSFYLLQY